MPQLTNAQIDELRQHPHILGRMYLYVFVPPTVFSARVSGDHVYGAQDVMYHTGHGSVFDVRRGMTLWVGTEPRSQNRGVVRIRADGAVIPWLFLAQNPLTLEDGWYLTVVDEYRLWHIDPFITNAGVIYKDYYNGFWPPAPTIGFPPACGGAGWENIYQPVPVMGPHSIAWVSEDHVYDWSLSWPCNPLAGDTIAAWTSAFPGGTPGSSGSQAGTVTWNMDAGARWVTLSVRDSRGVTSELGKRLYVTLDGTEDNLYVDFQPSPRQGSVDQGGFSMSFTVNVEADEADFPDGALVIWFVRGGTQEGIGGNWPGRTHIKFIGHIRQASTHKEPETGHVTFEADTVQELMKSLPVFPNFLESVDPGACNLWTEAVNLTVQRAFTLHARWMSTLFEVADVIFEPLADTRIREHEFPRNSLRQQLINLVDRDYRYRIGCDYHSTVYVNKDPQYLSRPAPWQAPSGIDTIIDIADEDWHGALDLPEPLEKQISYILASGIASPAAGAVTPYFSEAPGDIPYEHGTRQDLSRLICTDQVALNVLSGLVLAHRNNDFPDIPVKLEGQYYGLDHLFPMELIRLDVVGLPLPLSGGSTRGTKRDVDLSSEYFIPRRSVLQVVYDKDGALSHGLVSLNIEKVTYGPPGQTLVYPSLPTPEDPPPVPGWVPPSLATEVYALSAAGQGPWKKGADPSDDFVQYAAGLTGTWLNGRDLKIDHGWYPTSPRHVWIATQGGPAKSEDDMIVWTLMDGVVLTTPQNAALDAPAPTLADLDWYCICYDTVIQDVVYILAGGTIGGNARAWIYWTADGGVTWDNWQVRTA